MSIFIFVMSFSNDLDSAKSYVHCVIWVVLLFNIIFSTEQFFESDFSDGSIKELLTTGYNFFEIILSKFLSILIVVLLPIFAIGAVELEMIQQSPDKNFYILIGIFMITFSISLITGKLAMEELNN